MRLRVRTRESLSACALGDHGLGPASGAVCQPGKKAPSTLLKRSKNVPESSLTSELTFLTSVGHWLWRDPMAGWAWDGREPRYELSTTITGGQKGELVGASIPPSMETGTSVSWKPRCVRCYTKQAAGMARSMCVKGQAV